MNIPRLAFGIFCAVGKHVNLAGLAFAVKHHMRRINPVHPAEQLLPGLLRRALRAVWLCSVHARPSPRKSAVFLEMHTFLLYK